MASSLWMTDDGKGDVNVRSCRTTRSSASLAAIALRMRTFFEIISSLATDFVAGGVDMAAEECRDIACYSLQVAGRGVRVL
jgi:hypothetical protein